MLIWNGTVFEFDLEFEKEMNSLFPNVSDLRALVAQAGSHARARGLVLNAPLAWLKAWMKRADAAESAKRSQASHAPMDVDAARRWHEERHARAREEWLKSRGLDRPPGLPGDVYVRMLREEVLHMVKKAARKC